MDIFSPILAILAVRTSATVASSYAIALNASISFVSAVNASFASPSTKATNSSFLDTKSVSELTSTKAAVLQSSEKAILTKPSAATLPAFFAALASPFSLK